MSLTCKDCDAPYGKDGWVDVVIPDETWNKICPEDGVLCFRCMTKRIEKAGIDGVPVIVASGPYKDANEEWRKIGWEHGYKVGQNNRRTPTGKGDRMVKRYTSWDVVTDVGENIFVLEADYATLLAERDRLRECVSDFMSIYYERDVLCQDGSGHVDRCRCRKCVHRRARQVLGRE